MRPASKIPLLSGAEWEVIQKPGIFPALISCRTLAALRYVDLLRKSTRMIIKNRKKNPPHIIIFLCPVPC